VAEPLSSDTEAAALALLRRVLSLGDAELRRTSLFVEIATRRAEELAAVLDVVCARAEQADAPAREFMIPLTDALRAPDLAARVSALREEAARSALTALCRTLRPPSTEHKSSRPQDPNDDRIPEYGWGRPLTLGERKSLARRPNRALIDRLLLDPHPDVIQRLLANPQLTEDDVLTMAAKRPARPDVLTAIAQSLRWVHRQRVRRALVLNPSTPAEIAAPICALLVRQELKLVIETTTVSPAIRALCMEYLERRPPAPASDDDGGTLH
jgi:hypothetical protein